MRIISELLALYLIWSLFALLMGMIGGVVNKGEDCSPSRRIAYIFPAAILGCELTIKREVK
jgi:hypothetical protein